MLKYLRMKCEYHFEGLESAWRTFLSGHFRSLSGYFPVKNNERHKINSVNWLGVFETIITRYFCIIFWVTKTTPLFPGSLQLLHYFLDHYYPIIFWITTTTPLSSGSLQLLHYLPDHYNYSIIFWITKTTPLFLVGIEWFQTQGFKKWVI
jgi:hypothetical protein